VRWNSSRILRAFCDELVKPAETGASGVGNHRISSVRIGRQNSSCGFPTRHPAALPGEHRQTPG
jgi:hypothetical protein